jgi:hypothetical protein
VAEAALRGKRGRKRIGCWNCGFKRESDTSIDCRGLCVVLLTVGGSLPTQNLRPDAGNTRDALHARLYDVQKMPGAHQSHELKFKGLTGRHQDLRYPWGHQVRDQAPCRLCGLRPSFLFPRPPARPTHSFLFLFAPGLSSLSISYLLLKRENFLPGLKVRLQGLPTGSDVENAAQGGKAFCDI